MVSEMTLITLIEGGKENQRGLVYVEWQPCVKKKKGNLPLRQRMLLLFSHKKIIK